MTEKKMTKKAAAPKRAAAALKSSTEKKPSSKKATSGDMLKKLQLEIEHQAQKLNTIENLLMEVDSRISILYEGLMLHEKSLNRMESSKKSIGHMEKKPKIFDGIGARLDRIDECLRLLLANQLLIDDEAIISLNTITQNYSKSKIEASTKNDNRRKEELRYKVKFNEKIVLPSNSKIEFHFDAKATILGRIEKRSNMPVIEAYVQLFTDDEIIPGTHFYIYQDAKGIIGGYIYERLQ